jgi:hypothetical protein
MKQGVRKRDVFARFRYNDLKEAAVIAVDAGPMQIEWSGRAAWKSAAVVRGSTTADTMRENVGSGQSAKVIPMRKAWEPLSEVSLAAVDTSHGTHDFGMGIQIWWMRLRAARTNWGWRHPAVTLIHCHCHRSITLNCWSACHSIRGAEVVRSYSSHRRALEPVSPRLPCGGREYLRLRVRRREQRSERLSLRDSW